MHVVQCRNATKGAAQRMHDFACTCLTAVRLMQIRIKSFASRAQLAVTQAEIDKAVELEWDRRLITVLGAANNRLYEFRLQTANSTYEKSKVNMMLLGQSMLSLPINDNL